MSKLKNPRVIFGFITATLVLAALLIVFVRPTNPTDGIPKTEQTTSPSSAASGSAVSSVTSGTPSASSHTTVTSKQTKSPSPSTSSHLSTTTKPSSTTKDGMFHYKQPAGAVWNLRLVNQWNMLPVGFESELQLADAGRGKLFDQRAIPQLNAMLTAGKAYNLYIVSPYRTVKLQTNLFDRQTNQVLPGCASLEEARQKASTVVARPYASEHHTGLAVDLLGSGYSDLTQNFEKTPAFKWLKENCAKYGFILRYPSNKQPVTGVIYEPWHYRYVGVEAAQAIMNTGITLEEYLQQNNL